MLFYKVVDILDFACVIARVEATIVASFGEDFHRLNFET